MAIIAEGKPPIEGKDAYNQESIFRGSNREDIEGMQSKEYSAHSS